MLMLNGAAGACLQRFGTARLLHQHIRRQTPRGALRWVVRDKPQQTNQLEFLRPSTARRLTPLGRHLLDVGASEGYEQACRDYASFLSATSIAAPRL